jgi:CBS domain containing-hemolysin-like protein
MSSEFILLIVLIVVSAFFSGSEMAYVVSNKIKIEIRARKNEIGGKSAYSFTNNPQDFFSTILLGNNIINIAFASISTVVLTASFGFNEFSILLLSTFFLLIFGELLPKYLSRELAERVILLTALPIRILYYILYPFIKVISSLSSFLIHSSNIREENLKFLFSKEDIESLVSESHAAGVVNKSESDIIKKVLALSEQRVYEAMRPRTEITGIEIEESIAEVLDLFIDSGYSKMPVYEENLDNIKGVVYAYDLFKNPQNLESIMREIIYVPETKKSFEMLNEFLNKRVSIAVVIDEFGGTAGIVTMEDIIEELFGEIEDEYDIEEDICKQISTNEYVISGKVEIDYINEKYNLQITSGDYETIAGYIIYNIGRIPVQGENIKLDNFNILIARASQTTIDIVRLTVITEPVLSAS